MTPGRLTEIECPQCHEASWTIDSDYRGTDGVFLPYPERPYLCRRCAWSGPGWTLKRQSPPAFLLQPHDMYPMSHADFDYWVAILRTNFPDHPHLAVLEEASFLALQRKQPALTKHMRVHIQFVKCAIRMARAAKTQLSAMPSSGWRS